MSYWTGRRAQIGIGKESPRGTITAASYWMPQTAISFSDKITKALTAGAYGHITDAAMTGQVVQKWAEGDIEGEVNVQSFGLLLLALFGTDGYSLNETGVGQHDYTIQDDNISPSLSIWVNDPIDAMAFGRAMVNSMTIDVALGEFVKHTTNFVSNSFKGQTPPSPSYSVDQRWVHPNLTFKVAAEPGEIASASAISLKNLSLTIEKNVERLDILGSTWAEDIVNKGLKLFGTLELNYEDNTWRNYMMDNTIRAMQIKLTGTKLIGATQYATLDMVFPKVHFFEWEPSRGLGDIAGQSINFEILFDLSNDRLWSTMQLLNSVTSEY